MIAGFIQIQLVWGVSCGSKDPVSKGYKIFEASGDFDANGVIKSNDAVTSSEVSSENLDCVIVTKPYCMVKTFHRAVTCQFSQISFRRFVSECKTLSRKFYSQEFCHRFCDSIL